MKILYCGDSPAGGPANYLLAIMRSLGAEVTHVHPGVKLQHQLAETRYDAIVFSDYGYDCLPEKTEQKLIYQILSGTGCLMVGGWGSFAGPFGNWQRSEIAKLLPVQCQNKDDRVNLGSGLYPFVKKKHVVLNGLDFKNAPVLIGLNRVKPRKDAQVLLTARAFQPSSKKMTGPDFPLLAVSAEKDSIRSAAFTTDFAPHWCGGWVDWGKKRCKLPVTDSIQVEISDQYLKFGVQLLSWLSQKI